MIIWFKLKAMRIAGFKFLYLKTVRITGFKYSYLTYCEDHGFQVVVFENCAYHRFHLFKLVNRRGGHFQKNPPYFSQKISSWVNFNVFYLLFFFEERSFLFPNIMRMFLFIIDSKIKIYIFFLLKNTPFCQKKVRVIMG